MKPTAIVGLLGGLALATTLALVVVVAVEPVTPEIAEVATASDTVSVDSSQFTDPHTVSLTVTSGMPAAITSPVSGRVTAASCRPGEAMSSGTSPLSVDGTAVLALAMSVPPWRDIPQGATGSDVEALHAALTALGYDTTADGDQAGGSTTSALHAAFKKAGATDFTGSTLPLTQMVWLPEQETTVATCSVAVGDRIGTDATIATGAASLLDVRVTSMPSLLAPGDRTVTVGGVTVTVDSDGVVSDPSALEGAISASDTDVAPTGTLQLVDAIAVSGIPATAISTADGVTGCVQAGDQVIGVKVVGSQLGTTYVMFDGDAPDTISLTAPEQGCQ
ncbi:hypothetical protein [Demequina capsici]|uniref:Peptidoglycan binding domain-containing protein n=1 Tax=Demequina capsici TaxID=3075620 RepID=A0AA96F6M3_9MICO|nr:hypothetical protein [Demequina sp. OYTSA14]WNM24289.1 hypothetical protein RN606_13140 [Demequina sp. OYTSA14]